MPFDSTTNVVIILIISMSCMYQNFIDEIQNLLHSCPYYFIVLRHVHTYIHAR